MVTRSPLSVTTALETHLQAHTLGYGGVPARGSREDTDAEEATLPQQNPPQLPPAARCTYLIVAATDLWSKPLF